MGDVHSHTTKIALNTQCGFRTTHHPQAVNWFSHQFYPAAEFINSIRGNTVSRVANSEQVVRLARGLKVALLDPFTFYKGAVCVRLHVSQQDKDVPNDGSLVLSRSGLQPVALEETKSRNG